MLCNIDYTPPHRWYFIVSVIPNKKAWLGLLPAKPPFSMATPTTKDLKTWFCMAWCTWTDLDCFSHTGACKKPCIDWHTNRLVIWPFYSPFSCICQAVLVIAWLHVFTQWALNLILFSSMYLAGHTLRTRSVCIRKFSFQFRTICMRNWVEVGGTIRNYMELIWEIFRQTSPSQIKLEPALLQKRILYWKGFQFITKNVGHFLAKVAHSRFSRGLKMQP